MAIFCHLKMGGHHETLGYFPRTAGPDDLSSVQSESKIVVRQGGVGLAGTHDHLVAPGKDIDDLVLGSAPITDLVEGKKTGASVRENLLQNVPENSSDV
jgi:hypothetical protein